MKPFYQGSRGLLLSYRTKLDFPAHLHHALELILMEKGETTVLDGRGSYRLSAGEMFVSFPNQVHGYENSTPDTRAYVLIVPVHPYLSRFRSFLDQGIPERAVLERQEWEKLRLKELLSLALADFPDASEAVLQGYLSVIAGKLLSLLKLKPFATGDAGAIRSALLYLNEHYTEPLSRRTLAKEIGYNESYLSHLFARQLNTTLTEYLTNIRLNEALSLLAETEESISRVALSLGFGSIRSFNRAFSQKMGLSPSAWRKKEKEKHK